MGGGGEYERKETAELIHKAIAALPERNRVAVVLRDINGLSYAEIAEILHCKVGTVKSRIFDARFKLHDALQRYL